MSLRTWVMGRHTPITGQWALVLSSQIRRRRELLGSVGAGCFALAQAAGSEAVGSVEVGRVKTLHMSV
jgi:hypothetical protein